MALTICSLNVRSVRAAERRAAMLDSLSATECDVICLQECCVNYVPADVEWQYGKMLWSPACGARNEGVGILFKSGRCDLLSWEVVVPGRCVMALVEVAGQRCRIFNCYAPAEKKE